MFSLEIMCDPAHRDLLVADLWEQGSTGITELDDSHLRAFFEDGCDRQALLGRYPQALARDEDARDWVAVARDLMHPMPVGSRFFLVPEWCDDPAPPGRFRITVNPGLAFGTGVHESTRLCLEALEDYCKPGIAVLDVGTGSGILAEAASLLGAHHVIGCDTDPVSVAIARSRVTDCFVGSCTAVRTGFADLALANISPEAIVELAPDLARSLRPGGILLASGFERQEIDWVKAALARIVEVRQKGSWTLVVAAVDR